MNVWTSRTFSGIVEMDKTYFLYSKKGNIIDRKSRKRGGKAKFRGISNDQICVLVARDRQKMTYSGVIGRVVLELQNLMKRLVAN
jgi:hypothetical protein